MNMTEKMSNENGDHVFARGSGPLLSVLIPTRGHPAELCAAIDSLHSLSKHKSIEYLLKIDEDDTPTLEIYEKLRKMVEMRAFISPRGNGYLDFHHWINELCKDAKGDWILLWNDDALAVQEGWDLVVSEAAIDKTSPWHGCPDVLMFIAETLGRPDASEFVIVRRKVVDILGHMSLNPHCDNWIVTVLSFLGSAFKVPMKVNHINTKDKIREEVLEAYKIAGKQLTSMDAMREKIADLHKLIVHIDEWHKQQPKETAETPTKATRIITL